jgi:hypothetical protein
MSETFLKEGESNKDFVWKCGKLCEAMISLLLYNVSRPQSSVKDASDFVECFSLFFSTDFIQQIIQQMKRYAQ